MPKKLPRLPGLALAIIIVLGLLVAAMAAHISIIDGAEGAGPAQGFTPKYRTELIAWTTSADDRLPAPASVQGQEGVYFAMAPSRDDWALQRYAGKDAGWVCINAAYARQGFIAYSYSESDNDDLGRVIFFRQPYHAPFYLRGAAPKENSYACEGTALNAKSAPDSELEAISRVLLLTFGGGAQNQPGYTAPIPPPQGYSDATLQTADDLLYQAPGGDWVTQMLVSVAAAVVVMVILRSATGLMIGIMVLPVSAFGMALIGYGSYWYVTVMALIFVLAVAAFTLLTRRPSG